MSPRPIDLIQGQTTKPATRATVASNVGVDFYLRSAAGMPRASSLAARSEDEERQRKESILASVAISTRSYRTSSIFMRGRPSPGLRRGAAFEKIQRKPRSRQLAIEIGRHRASVSTATRPAAVSSSLSTASAAAASTADLRSDFEAAELKFTVSPLSCHVHFPS